MPELRVLGQPFEGGKVGFHTVLEWAILNTARWIAVVGFLKVLGETAESADKVGTGFVPCKLPQLIRRQKNASIPKTKPGPKARSSIYLGYWRWSVIFRAYLSDNTHGCHSSHQTNFVYRISAVYLMHSVCSELKTHQSPTHLLLSGLPIAVQSKVPGTVSGRYQDRWRYKDKGI